MPCNCVGNGEVRVLPQRQANFHSGHRPQASCGYTFSKNLTDLTNPRLQRLGEKLSAYQFTITFVPGKTHYIADALSRAPIFPDSEELDIQVDTALAHLTITQDPALKIDCESIDNDHTQCKEEILKDTANSNLSQQLKSSKGDISIRDGLIMLGAKRIVLPKPAIKPIMSRIHIGHTRQEKILALAQQLYFWHRMANDIKTIIHNCAACQTQEQKNHCPQPLEHQWPTLGWTSSTLPARNTSFASTYGSNFPSSRG